MGSCAWKTLGTRHHLRDANNDVIMLVHNVVLCATIAVTGVFGQAFQCPGDGFYPDNNSCDKYYDCYNGVAKEKLCPDGLVFDYRQEASLERCEFPFLVPCDGPTQPPKPSGVCLRQNGLFWHEDATVCDKYYECTGGVPVPKTCFIGGVFNPDTGVCDWETAGTRTGCVKHRETVNGFTCPEEAQPDLVGGPGYYHKLYPDLDDCRYFYTCHNGQNPVRNGCLIGTVFNDKTLTCDSPENVPECANYYLQ